MGILFDSTGVSRSDDRYSPFTEEGGGPTVQQPHPRAALEWKKLDFLDLRSFLNGWGVVHGPMAQATQGTGCEKMALVVLFQHLGDADREAPTERCISQRPRGGTPN